ncbi:MAG: ATP-binding cassette domain-containing protein [Pseudomonadota bacterium]
MSEATVISLQDAARARYAPPPLEIVAEELERRQSTIPAQDCHIVLDRLSYAQSHRSGRTTIFNNVSIGFPRGRKIVVLGHEGSGKSILLDLCLRQLPPASGQVIINSRVSWKIPTVQFLEGRLSLRENAIFLSRVLGLPPRRIIDAAVEYIELSPRQLGDPLASLPVWARMRFGFLILVACEFDCHLVTSLFRPYSLRLQGAKALKAMELVYGRDYIACAHAASLVPDTCDLVYILYEGRFYLFEDVDQAIAVFEALPTPVSSVVKKQRPEADEDTSQDELL